MVKEFECKKCGKIIEVWERFEAVPESCVECGGELKHIISKTSFHLQGSGWAFDGYGAKKIKKSNDKNN